MVQKLKDGYICEECGFGYKNRKWAEKCELWCKEKKSCNIEITKYAMSEVKGGKENGTKT